MRRGQIDAGLPPVGEGARPRGGLAREAAPDAGLSERLDATGRVAGDASHRDRFAAFGDADLVVASVSWPADGALVAVRGRDRLAPRSLTLWRIDPSSGESAPLADAASRPDGSYDFERVALPGAGATLVVTQRGVAPDSAGTSGRAALPPRSIEAPRARLHAPGSGAILETASARLPRWRLEVEGTRPRGTIVVADRDARELLRYPVPAAAPRARRGVSIEVPAPPEGGWRLMQELPDGRSSEWRAALVADESARALAAEASSSELDAQRGDSREDL